MSSAARRPVRTLSALAAASALTLAMTACGSDKGSTSSSSSSTSSSAGGTSAVTDGKIADVKATGGDDKTAPKLELKTPFGVAEYASTVLKKGSGTPTDDKSIAVVKYTLVNGTDGKVIDETYSTKETGFDVGDATLISGLRKALTGVTKGSRVVAALPPAEAFGDQGNAQIGVKGTDTVVFLFDVVNVATKLPEAEGTAVTPTAKNLPEVTFESGKQASFTMPKADPPKDLVIQPLIKGKGAKVEQGDTAVVTYTGALWRNGQIFDSSFKQGPTASFSFPVGAGRVVAGWDKGIEGQTVGSRLLLIVPPKDGYGDKGQGEIKGTDTMVFVVDILAKY